MLCRHWDDILLVLTSYLTCMTVLGLMQIVPYYERLSVGGGFKRPNYIEGFSMVLIVGAYTPAETTSVCNILIDSTVCLVFVCV